ncbi:hypothetical protein CV740_14890 [Enterococcus faecium]|nr:hypothetical protein CV740_14890 [Enterococcus faecium]
MSRSKKVLLLFAAACLFLGSLIILFPASAEETKTDLSEGTSISSVVESPTHKTIYKNYTNKELLWEKSVEKTICLKHLRKTIC